MCQFRHTKGTNKFYSAQWHCGYSPDQCVFLCDWSSKPMTDDRNVLDAFPHSQQRPVLISAWIQIPPIRSFPQSRWNVNSWTLNHEVNNVYCEDMHTKRVSKWLYMYTVGIRFVNNCTMNAIPVQLWNRQSRYESY